MTVKDINPEMEGLSEVKRRCFCFYDASVFNGRVEILLRKSSGIYKKKKKEGTKACAEATCMHVRAHTHTLAAGSTSGRRYFRPLSQDIMVQNTMK